MQEENSQTINKSLPSIPPLLISPTPLQDYSYDLYNKRKHLMMLNGEEDFDSTKNEVEGKLTHLAKRCEQNSFELISTGERIEINESLFTQCKRCQKKILISQFSTHLLCHASIILDNLFLGDKISAQSKKQLVQRMKVTHVVNCACQLPNYLEKEGLNYLQLQLLDQLDQQIQSQMIKASEYIKKAHQNGGVVFVHCAVGKSRSVSVILTYLLRQRGMGIKQGLELVKQKRHIAQPNMGYMKQLLLLEEKLKMQKQQGKERSIQVNVKAEINENQNNSRY